MTDTHLRDRIVKLAKTNVKDAYKLTKKIKEPWFKVQAISFVVRYSDNSEVLKLAKEAQ